MAINDPRTVLYLVRHGEADSNRDGRFGGWSPVPLTELGRRQAQGAAIELRRRAPTVVVSSDIARARQTAEPIAEALGVELRFEPGLRERSLGVFDGLSFEEAEQRYPADWARLTARDHGAVPEGGELAETVYARVAQAIDRIVTDHAGQRIAVVSHGLALFHAFSHVCGLGVPGPHTSVFVLVDNASISHVEHKSGRWRIMSLNDTSHLRDLTIG